MAKEKAAHQVLARKYRPQGFDEVVGQPAVSQTLKHALESKRLAHAYLFTGPRGCGKTTSARILAKALNCEKGPTPEPCDACVSCKEIATSSSLDVLEMDAASNTGVDDVRQMIIETVGLAPSRDRYKVFIIDETHMLSTAAFNALLKTIEEPPPHAVFILATTEAHKVPATIASRCQRFKFRPVPADLLAGHLSEMAKKEKIAVEPAALELLARAAEGSLRDAVSLLDQCRSAADGKVTAESVREMFGFTSADLLLGVAGALAARDTKALAKWLKAVYEDGVDPSQLLRDLRAGVEGVYLESLGAGTADPAWAKALAATGPDGLAFLLRRLNRALEEMRFGDSPRLALELGLFGCLEAAHDLGEWVLRLEALEKRLVAGGGGAPLSPAPSVSPRPVSAPAPAASAAAAAPVPAAAATGDLRGAWAKAVAAVSAEKPILGALLEAAAVEAKGAGLVVRFAKEFDRQGAERARALIEQKLAAAAGAPAPLSFELGAAPAPEKTSFVDPAIPDAPAAPPGRWKDVTEGAAPSGGGALKKAEGIFGGKVRIVKKPTGGA
ncbi:MAG: DNA polymerase III subunit gamma/tau [Elusimicrobiota bacterium]|nr:DNA polymerase III subunit gamma/tau [Elusimicrobiota bacterium]